MSRDLAPLVASQRAAIARSRAELEALDGQLAVLEPSTISGQVHARLDERCRDGHRHAPPAIMA